MFKKLAVLLATCVLLCSVSGCSGKEYPSRSIDLVVSSSAGGGMDLTCRAVAAEMEKTLGQKINVSNMPGASGGTATSYVKGKNADGYTMLGLSEQQFSIGVLDACDTTTKDWEYFLVGGTPAVISVRADSKYNTIQDVIDDMKSKPGNVTWANSVVGCIWDIKSTLFAEAADVKYKFMPYQGSNPSILACLNGEVDVILTGVGEQSEFLAAKKLKPLAMVELESMDVPGYNNVPSICDTLPDMKKSLPVNQVVGMAVSSKVGKDELNKIEEAFKNALTTEAVKKYASDSYINISGLTGSDAKEYAEKMESLFSWMLYDKGIATKSPEELNIPKPDSE